MCVLLIEQRVLNRSIKSENAIFNISINKGLVLNLNNKTVAFGTLIIIISLVALAVLSAEISATLQSVNPVAALAAVVVAVIGLIWFKRTSR